MIEHHNDPTSANLAAMNLNDVPFNVSRIYWISNFRPGTVRGQHAHKKLTQLMIVVSGHIELELYNGKARQIISMQSDTEPVLIQPGQWRVMKNASSDTVILVLASHDYDESDYIRNWEQYLKWFEHN